MPGPTDAKIVIDEGAAAQAEGKSPAVARMRAIRECAPNLTAEQNRKFAMMELKHQAALRKADDELLAEQDDVLADMLISE